MKFKRTINIFPFEMVSPGARIVLWGAGDIGRQYYKQLIVSNYCHIEAVIDMNAEKVKDFPVPVMSSQFMKEVKGFDYVVISVSDRKANMEIVAMLKSFGILSSKIVSYLSRRSYNESVLVSNDIQLMPDDAFLQEVRRSLHIHLAVGHNLIRVGGEHDGGYIMLDDFRRGGIAYSFGICDDVSWDASMADAGFEIYMYDHTIESLPEQKDKFHFFPKGIADESITEKLDTLEHFIASNGHDDKSHMILKMDVEGAEWGFLEMVDAGILKRFDQIVMELHGLLDGKLNDKILAGIKKINETHAVVHVHGNNCGTEMEWKGICYTDALEVTWANRSVYELSSVGKIALPLAIDAPCDKLSPEVCLAGWNEI